MPKAPRNTLSGLAVAQAMRRQVVCRPHTAPIDHALNALLKYKVNALLVVDADHRPTGVLSKTDIMGAYYAGVPIDTPVEAVMSGPPLFCRPDDPLESALHLMHAKGIYRLFVQASADGEVAGVLAYPDIVGLLYRFCRQCDYSHRGRKGSESAGPIGRFTVRDTMTEGVQAVAEAAPLHQAMEALSAYRLGALLVTDGAGRPKGVLSKTDLTLAYKHRIDPEVPVETIMSTPVQSCSAEDLLEAAIRRMIYTDVRRLFVHQGDPETLIGVFSLSDAARARSGSCHACVSSRINLET